MEGLGDVKEKEGWANCLLPATQQPRNNHQQVRSEDMGSNINANAGYAGITWPPKSTIETENAMSHRAAGPPTTEKLEGGRWKGTRQCKRQPSLPDGGGGVVGLNVKERPTGMDIGIEFSLLARFEGRILPYSALKEKHGKRKTWCLHESAGLSQSMNGAKKVEEGWGDVAVGMVG
jgi:hypothetical protein